ncbi:hypothetical protein J1N35_036447 [Gossypium stocksii]|uniref:Uncharacterized protein n=1 Tax=Gossypium stocksii TaxID=47602 RepID=A0A9D3ZKP0_9ROSI|nr:hypothetical protein J1N35_036447 [Gossypium stocksii]
MLRRSLFSDGTKGRIIGKGCLGGEGLPKLQNVHKANLTNETVKENLPPLNQDAQDDQIDRLTDSSTQQADEALGETQPVDEPNEIPVRIDA